MHIGPFQFANNVFLAPMAGITDAPFRQLCLELGAGHTVAEMLTSDMRLWQSSKSLSRKMRASNERVHSVQIAGVDPQQMAMAARVCVDEGADIIDINMGCPAKKVCRVNAGSALLADEKLVASILQAVVKAVSAPVTLKMRIGTSPNEINGVQIAKLAEECGIQALTVHGRTRACRFRGPVDYHKIREIKTAVNIPVIANGDITSSAQAKKVLAITNADAIMIGRGSQGRPWIFRQVSEYLINQKKSPEPALLELRNFLLNHLQSIYSLYGNQTGVRIARKHIGWYLHQVKDDLNIKTTILRESDADRQYFLVDQFLLRAAEAMEIAA